MVRFARRSKSCRTTSATWRDGRTRAQRGYSSWKRSLRWTINLLTLFTHIWQQQGTPRVLFIQIPNHNSDLMRFILQVKKAAFEQERIDWESANNVTIEDLKRMSLESIDGKKKSKVNEANADIKLIQFFNSCFRVRWAESASGWVPQNKWFSRTMNYLVWKMLHGEGWKLIFGCCESLFWGILPIDFWESFLTWSSIQSNCRKWSDT